MAECLEQLAQQHSIQDPNFKAQVQAESSCCEGKLHGFLAMHMRICARNLPALSSQAKSCHGRSSCRLCMCTACRQAASIGGSQSTDQSCCCLWPT